MFERCADHSHLNIAMTMYREMDMQYWREQTRKDMLQLT